MDTPYFAARGRGPRPVLRQEPVLKPADLDPVNDVWRYDGKKQGAGPRYGMAKDFSQDSMFWYRTACSTAALDSRGDRTGLLRRVARHRQAPRATQGRPDTSPAGRLPGTLMATMTASAGGSLFTEDLARVDFSSPEARKALDWYLDYANRHRPERHPAPTRRLGRPHLPGQPHGDELRLLVGRAHRRRPETGRGSRLAPAPLPAAIASAPAGGTGFWIPRDAKNKDASWQFFEWYFGEAQARAASGWGIPTLNSLRSQMPQTSQSRRCRCRRRS